jgi:hypothetical protein
MNPKFQRFLKETKQDLLKKERLERKEAKEAQKREKLALKEEEKRLKQLAKEEAKAEKLRQKVAKQEEKRLAKEAKLLLKTTKSKKKPSASPELSHQQTLDKTKPLPNETLELELNLDLGFEDEQTSTNTTVEKTEILDSSEKEISLNDKENTFLGSSNTDQDKNEDSGISNSSTTTTESGDDIQSLNSDPKSLFEMFKTEGDYSWLKPDNLAAKGAFNLINKYLHPKRDLARGIAILPIKGTSFEDKRINCLKFLSEVRAGESTGEISLVPEPNNPFDPNALAVYDLKNNAMLGYIPKAQEINACYAKSLNENKFCGGYIIEGKNSMLKGEENAMILIATGWI